MIPVSLCLPHLQAVSPGTSFSENVRNTTIIIYYDSCVPSWGVTGFYSHKRSEALRKGNRCLLAITVVAVIVVNRDSKKKQFTPETIIILSLS